MEALFAMEEIYAKEREREIKRWGSWFGVGGVKREGKKKKNSKGKAKNE